MGTETVLAAEMQGVATSLLGRFGTDVVINHEADNPIVVQGYLYPFRPNQIDGSHVITGDMQVILSPSDFPDITLGAEESITAGGDIWQIKGVEYTQLAGKDVVLVLHCRRVGPYGRQRVDDPNNPYPRGDAVERPIIS